MNRTCPTTNFLVLNVDDAKLEKALTKTGKLETDKKKKQKEIRQIVFMLWEWWG